jgi:uncharacterized membrane protein
MIFDNVLDWVAFGWFLTCWVGYTYYSKRKAKDTECLSALLYGYRVEWMRNVMMRENRISDLALIGNLKQMVNFMASTTIFVLAGAITLLHSTDSIMDLLTGYSFTSHTTVEQVQFKLFVLVMIFVYVFFRFTWAMRQHTFSSILLGAAPFVKGRELAPEEEDFALQMAKVSDRAGHEFNYGLRSYYFGLAFLSWFASPLALIPACTLVTLVLYRREFISRTLDYLVKSRKSYDAIKAAEHARDAQERLQNENPA